MRRPGGRCGDGCRCLITSACSSGTGRDGHGTLGPANRLCPRHPRGGRVMVKDLKVPGMVPVKIIVAAVLALAATAGAARAEPSEKKCLDVTGFSANIVSHGGKSTLIPAAGFARA